MNMKKTLAIAVLALCSTSHVFAGGILTNTNQSAHFIRMVARDASVQIDAAYTNPAGLVKLNDGFHFSFSNQSAFQTRTITSTFAPFAGFGGDATKSFKGTASAPIIPSIQAAYKKGKWVLSGNIAVTGGGGKATFNDGLPSFESTISMLPGLLAASGITTNNYSVDAYMRGSSFIYGAQIGGSYAINNMFSVYGGFRLNIVNNRYEGHLRNISFNPQHPMLNPTGGMMSAQTFFNDAASLAKGTAANLNPFIESGAGAYTVGQLITAGKLSQAMADQLRAGLNIGNAEQFNQMQIQQVQAGYVIARQAYEANAKAVADKNLDSSQSGWGISPILGFNFSYNNLNVGMKYEFRTALNVENKTKVDDTGLFKDGVNTPHDIPALFTVGASYQITPKLLASVGYHHFFDSDAKMADDKQKHINGGTNEYLFGAEYKIDDMFLVSAGGQITRYGVKDEYQRDLSFSINSYSIGLGGAVNVAKNVLINVGYFWTTYSDWTKNNPKYVAIPNTNPQAYLAGKDVFSRTNKVFAAGVDFSF